MIAAAVFIVILILLVVARRNKTRKTRQLEKLLRPIRLDEVRAFTLPDGIGGVVEIDRLLLTKQGLLIIETYPFSGHLFGGEQIDQWTQIIDGRSYKFTNPLGHAQNIKYALQLIAPKVPIFYRVVFTDDSDFPKGKPEVVSTLQTLEQDLKQMLQAPKMAPLTATVWEKIKRMANNSQHKPLREVTF
jgi:hypothetical protein